MKSLSQAGDNQVDLTLKIFKSVFVRNFVEEGKRFSDSELNAALLIVAFHCLLKAVPQSIFGKRRTFVQQELSSLSNGDWLSFCLRLYEMVLRCCPIKDTLPPPDLKSIASVRSIVKEENWRALGESVSSIGFTYEILGLAARKRALSATQAANKELSIEELIAFTQLYTPDWVVDFLIANTAIPLIDQDKGKTIDDRFTRWLLPQTDRETRIRRTPVNLKLIDPACGSGQFLLSAFDFLYGLHRAAGSSSSRALHMVLFDNLYGADIDDKSIWVSSLGLLVKSLLLNETIASPLNNLICPRFSGNSHASELLGSVSRIWLRDEEHILGRRYDIVVTNPPYIGRKSLSRELKLSLKDEYPRCGSDICAAFLERSMEMLSPGGRMGMITQSSLLTLPSYQDLRQHLFNRYHFDSIVQCGTGVFPRASGEKIDSVLLIGKLPARAHAPLETIAGNFDLRTIADHFVSLEKKLDKADELQKMISLSKKGGSPNWSKNSSSYRIMQTITNAPPLSSIAQVKQGLATTDNQRFVRSYWDIPEEDLGPVWVPYIKGAGSERWYSENNFVVKWGKDGSEIKQAVVEAYPYLKGKSSWVVKNEQFYFKPGLCFSFINKHRLAVRRLPAGSIFDVASSAIFSNNGDEDFLFAYLNSSLLSKMANLINPTINMQVGDIKRLPVPPFSIDTKEKLGQLARQCYEKKLAIASLWSNQLIESGDGLNGSLTKLRNKQIKLYEELGTSEGEIDELVLFSFASLGYLCATDLKELGRNDNALDRQAKHDNDERAFAARVLVEAAANLMRTKQSERIVIVPLLADIPFHERFGFDNASATTLETLLGMPLTKYFARSKVCDLSKQAKGASRYLSVYLPESKAIMLLSARSMKTNLQPCGDSSLKGTFEAKEILKRAELLLKNKGDWTTNDLLKALGD
ncbi:MAG: hypothetical protein C5B53_03950 [Candidatus Melainabacteria bacterium]|nr:MAG: hypothetical protein C5B53_03950 [Candidatus Melainabacteria bacterium]